MAQEVNVSFTMDADLKRSMEETCAKLGMSMKTAFTIFAEEVSSEKKLPFDPFYSKSNMRYLEKLINKIESGEAHFAEHELIEVED